MGRPNEQRNRGEGWDGVRNYRANNNMKKMKIGKTTSKILTFFAHRFKVALELILEGFSGSKKRRFCCFLQLKSNAEKHDVVNQSTCAQIG